MMPAVEKPVFVIGSGRSGTTILYNLMSLHPRVYWFSNLSNLFPHRRLPILAHRLLDLPVLGSRLKRRIIGHPKPRLAIRPGEGGNIFHGICGFLHDRRTTEGDYDADAARCLLRAIETHRRMTGRERFLCKQTANTQRLRLLNRIFPDALYVHIIRDGRAVANSLHHTDWWKEVDIWWLGARAAEAQAREEDPIVLCGLNWKHNVEEIMAHRALFGDRYLEIRYEALVTAVGDTVGRVLAFTGLDRDVAWMDLLPQTLVDMNTKWRNDLSQRQKDLLEEHIGASLRRLGYGK